MNDSPLKRPEPAATIQKPALSSGAADPHEPSLRGNVIFSGMSWQSFSVQGQTVKNLDSEGHTSSVATAQSAL